jgi:hypothetical protein
VATNLTIDYNGDRFRGAANSSSKRCERGRVVKLKKVKRGKDKVVARDRTNRSGRWAVRKGRARGRYYAIAAKKVFTNDRGVRVVCGFDKSPRERVR